jgi:hypothetical protein
VEVAFHYYRGGSYAFTGGKPCASVSEKTAFGFFILPLKGIGDGIFFNAVAICTPKSELFDGYAP